MNPEPRPNPLDDLNIRPEEAMRELIARYSLMVCAIAGRYLRDAEDVKDILNETFAEIYACRGSYDPERSSLQTWIGTIARNRAISMHRRDRDLLTYEGKTDVGDNVIPDFAETIQEVMDLERAVSCLGNLDQQIVRMKYYEGMTLLEIAQRLGVPYETVKKRHARVIRKLQRILPNGL